MKSVPVVADAVTLYAEALAADAGTRIWRLPETAPGPVAHTLTDGNNASLTNSVAVPAGSDFMLVWVRQRDTTAARVPTVTWSGNGGVTLTQIGAATVQNVISGSALIQLDAFYHAAA